MTQKNPSKISRIMVELIAETVREDKTEWTLQDIREEIISNTEIETVSDDTLWDALAGLNTLGYVNHEKNSPYYYVNITNDEPENWVEAYTN